MIQYRLIMSEQGYLIRRRTPGGRRTVPAALVCLAVLFFAVRRDLSAFGDAPQIDKLDGGIYSPPTIGTAIRFVAEMNTYLYHESRCEHIAPEEAAAIALKVAAGVRVDFPGWWFADNVALKARTWLAHRHIDDISCTHATVDMPTTMLNNIRYYEHRG